MINYLTTLDPRSLITGVIVILSICIWFMKPLLSAPQLEALRVFQGSEGFVFKAASFKEKKLCRKPIPRTCKDFQIEVYGTDSEKSKLYHLSNKKPTNYAEVKSKELIQIKFRYKDGLFWTRWSEEIPKKLIRRPFQLKVFDGQQGNQVHQPHQTQEPNEESYFRKQIEIVTNKINNSLANLTNQTNRGEEVVIRLIGPIGIGKSSLINTLFCAWKKEWRQIAVSYSGNKSITREVRKYELIPGKVWLADMPGFQDDSSFGLVPEVIAGCHDDPAPTDEPFSMNQAPKKERELREWKETTIRPKTAIILVLDEGDMNEGEAVNKKLIKQLIKGGYPCLAVITKVDKLQGQNEGSIDEDNFYGDTRVIDCCDKLTKIGVDIVIPMMNYRGNTDPHYKIDYVGLEILQKAMELARTL